MELLEFNNEIDEYQLIEEIESFLDCEEEEEIEEERIYLLLLLIRSHSQD